MTSDNLSSSSSSAASAGHHHQSNSKSNGTCTKPDVSLVTPDASSKLTQANGTAKKIHYNTSFNKSASANSSKNKKVLYFLGFFYSLFCLFSSNFLDNF